jgi:predicted metal-dependent phosphoesterase TrpH
MKQIKTLTLIIACIGLGGLLAGCTGIPEGGVSDLLPAIAVDCHSHTERSLDGDWTLEENLQWHGEAGFDAVFLTEHVVSAQPQITDTNRMQEWNDNHPNGPFALPGVEITTFHVHILGLGISTWAHYIPETEVGITLAWITGTVNYIHEQGGVAILAHPGPDVNDPEEEFYNDFTFEEILSTGMDGIETRNGQHYYPDWEANASANDMMETAGGDLHGEPGNAYSYTKLPSTATTPALMIAAITSGNCTSEEYPGA